MPVVAVNGMESRQKRFSSAPLVDQNGIGLHGTDALSALDPEVQRHSVTDITAETVTIQYRDIIDHIAVQIFPQSAMIEIEQGEIPITVDEAAVRILLCKFRMGFQNRCIRSDVEIDKIEDQVHPASVCLADTCRKIVHRTIFLVDAEIVVHAVGILRILCSVFFLAHAPVLAIFGCVCLKNRAKIDGCNAERCQIRQFFCDRRNRSLR